MSPADRRFDMFTRLKELCERPGPVGRGGEYNRWLLERWKRILPLDATILPPGNLVARVAGTGSPKILLAAHADEIAFSVKSVLERGLLAIAPAMPDADGRPPRRMGLHIAGQPALVLGEKEPIEGVFTTVTGHVTTYEQRTSSDIRFRDFWVDVGCTSRSECEKLGIVPGSPVVWNPPTRRLGEHRLVGKAMDDRAGLAVIEAVLANLDPARLDCELWVASTVMEECNALGSWALGAWANRTGNIFDLALVIDIGMSSDCPAVSETDVPVKMGDGVVLVVKDNAAHYDIEAIRALERCGNETKAPTKRASYGVDGSYASDGLRLIAQGIRSALIAFPAAYTHCPFEMVDERDLEAAVRLIGSFLQSAGRLYAAIPR